MFFRVPSAWLSGVLVVYLVVGFLYGVDARAQEHRVKILIEVRDGALFSPMGDESIAGWRHLRINSKGEGGASTLRRWRILETTLDESQSVLADLQDNPLVGDVHFETTYHTAAIPNDPLLPEQYAFSGGLGDISAQAAWEVTTSGPGAVIAILDGGVDLEHEDLSSKLWRNASEVAGNGQDDDGNGFVDDVHGWDFVADAPARIAIDHATHVAGIAGAASNNGIGVAGVDWQARIMSVRVLGTQGVGGESAIIEGIAYAVSQGADVINLSIVGSPSPAIKAAIEHAYASGVVVVAAVGNNGNNTAISKPYPACADMGGTNMVLGVGATDELGRPGSFSNWGECVDISAPGKRILSTRTRNRYGEMTGTSMSAPFVAGAASLYIAKHPLAGAAEVMSAVTSGDSFTGDKADTWNSRFRSKLNVAKVLGRTGEAVVSAILAPSPTSSVFPTSTLALPQIQPAGDAGGGGGGGGGDSGGGDEGGGGGSDEAHATLQSAKPVSAVATKLQAKIVPFFEKIFGRKPSPGESIYWKGRVARGEKKSEAALRGAMEWQFVHKKKGLVAGAVSTSDNVLTPAQLLLRVDSLFKIVHGRIPTAAEKKYWQSRVRNRDKTTAGALQGAMMWQKQKKVHRIR